jgi:hypothetical protein
VQGWSEVQEALNMKKSLVLAIIGMVLLCVSTVSAFEDTVERYPSGSYTDFWSVSYSTSDTVRSGSYGVSAIADPTGIDTSTLKLTATSYPDASAGYQYVTVKTNGGDYCFDRGYITFRLVSSDYGGIAQTTTDGLNIRLYEAGTTTQLISIHLDTTPSGTKYELIRSESYYNLFADGELVASAVNSVPEYGGDVDLALQLVVRAYQPTGSQITITGYVYFDDIADSSVLGIPYTITDASSNISFTYGSQLMRNSPLSDYNINLYLIANDDSAGKVHSWDISGATNDWGYITDERSGILGTNYGLYYLEMTRDDTIIADTYVYYDSLAAPVGLPEVLFSAGSNVGMEIRDADNNGGIISSGGSVYLYPDNASGIYPIRYTLQGAPYSFTASLNAIYGDSQINSTPFTFGGLSNNYVVTLDGESLAGTCANGDLIFSDNVTDGETVTIGSDVYEFESTGGVTGGNIQVNIGNISQTAENLTTAINTLGVSAVSASVVETPASSSYYYSNIEVTNNPGIADYQAKVTIPFETGMSTDVSNIRFFDGGVSIPYWVESKTDSVSAVVWIPISAGSDIQCRWGIAGETESESNITSVMETGSDFDSTELDTSVWTRPHTDGSTTVADGICTITSSAGSWDGIYTVNTYGVDYVAAYRLKTSAEASYWHAGWGALISAKTIQGSQWGEGQKYLTKNVASTITSRSTAYTSYTTCEICRNGAVSNIFREDGVVGGTHTTNIFTDTVGLGFFASGQTIEIDWALIRKYAATEPTLSVGATQINSETEPVTSVHIVSDSIGTASNSITTTETCTNAVFESETLTGGSGGSIVNTPTWSYEITDWTNITNHIFSFSPDLTVPGVYGYVKDVSTQAAIQSATVTVVGPNSTQYVYTDENGFYYLTNGMELNEQYTVSAAKSGYTQGVSFTVSTTAGATTRKDLLLDALASTDGVYYANHYVRFVVTDKYLYERYDASVTISGTDVATETQQTGSDGACGFEMTENIRYAVNTVYGSINQTDYIFPTESSYYIVLDVAGTSLLPASQFYEVCNITIAKNEVNSSHATITATYTDTGSGTNSVYFVLGQTYENNNTLNEMETSSVGAGNMTYVFTVRDYVGEDYVIKAVIDHDSFGAIEKYYGINFPGSALPFTGNMMVVLVVVVFFVVAMQWGKADAHTGAVLICGLGWWFYYLDIFERLGSATNTMIGVGLGLATVYAILGMINKKRDEGGI